MVCRTLAAAAAAVKMFESCIPADVVAAAADNYYNHDVAAVDAAGDGGCYCCNALAAVDNCCRTNAAEVAVEVVVDEVLHAPAIAVFQVDSVANEVLADTAVALVAEGGAAVKRDCYCKVVVDYDGVLVEVPLHPKLLYLAGTVHARDLSFAPNRVHTN